MSIGPVPLSAPRYLRLKAARPTFCMSRGSALPQGLQTDDAAQHVAKTASRIELWFYTYDPPTLKFFEGPDLVLSRQASKSRTLAGGVSVWFAGVESTFQVVALPNVVAVEEGSSGSRRSGS